MFCNQKGLNVEVNVMSGKLSQSNEVIYNNTKAVYQK